jgi:TIR domain-containing protein
MSPAALASEWFKRELNAGLIRELEERRVVVLPLLLENCEIPLFLRDKLYADFRKDFDSGLKQVLRSIAKITNYSRSRIENPKWHTDWAMDWGVDSRGLRVTLTFIEQAIDRPYTVQTIVTGLGSSYN